MTGRLLALAMPILLLFCMTAAPSAQARDDHRGRDRHEVRRSNDRRGSVRRGYDRRRYDRGRYDGRGRHRGYYRRYHGRRYWYEGGNYYDGPGGIIISF